MLCECFLYMGKSLFVFKLRFLGIQKLNINILLTSSFINPEVQRINSQGNLIQLLADICKVFDFIVGDLTVSGDLDQTAGERVDLIRLAMVSRIMVESSETSISGTYRSPIIHL